MDHSHALHPHALPDSTEVAEAPPRLAREGWLLIGWLIVSVTIITIAGAVIARYF